VTDGGNARIFESVGVGKGLRQLAGLEESLVLPANRDLQGDRPGRAFESAVPTRHAFEPGDPHRAMKKDLASHLASRLGTMHEQGLFDRLVIVASPEMLGSLRSALCDK